MKCFISTDSEPIIVKENFNRRLLVENLYRGKKLSETIMAIELILLTITCIALFLKIDGRFSYAEYIFMYLVMMIINFIYLLFIGHQGDLDVLSDRQLQNIKIGIVVYITLIMSWGSILSLMDQKLYSQIVPFMVNMIICSILYLLDDTTILIPYSVSILILFIGLPFFQSSWDVLIGHYVNSSAFIFISWLASRINYIYYFNAFSSKELLKKSKMVIEKEAEEIKKINIKLDLANKQLRDLALVDELTGIPNRRGFRNFIDSLFSSDIKQDSMLTFLMIDIDFFKQYNDNYGHDEGDKVLVAVANSINSIIKTPLEFVARWGGEEFLYCLYSENDITLKEISLISNSIRVEVQALKIPHKILNACDYLSVSIGASSIRTLGNVSISEGIALADKALYSAKNDSRNCTKYLKDEWLEPIQV